MWYINRTNSDHALWGTEVPLELKMTKLKPTIVYILLLKDEYKDEFEYNPAKSNISLL
jgi:hypothetical protein